MYQLHIAEKSISSWSLRPWILLQELYIPFGETIHHFLSNKEEQKKEWLTFSPTAKVPLLIDGSITIWDSLAICEYLAETYPQVWPQDKEARAWARCASAEMHSGFPDLRTICTFRLDVTSAPITTLLLTQS